MKKISKSIIVFSNIASFFIVGLLFIQWGEAFNWFRDQDFKKESPLHKIVGNLKENVISYELIRCEHPPRNWEIINQDLVVGYTKKLKTMYYSVAVFRCKICGLGIIGKPVLTEVMPQTCLSSSSQSMQSTPPPPELNEPHEPTPQHS